ncbi:hypothetical protein FRC14_004024 [Serendipita sp. 396]|nr:hypothetical protein FRC14_004024 [Serendipita sp. 396]KAG8780889.1 hypothetical protein FRC15_009197 [Serendipita sp. 397]KAG8802274.1 hypothetical protein FRC16_010016 [Serendipita sp. 398]KAG8863023.1 hypothetical protein FRC20_010928 [Serendipita sp. 405]
MKSLEELASAAELSWKEFLERNPTELEGREVGPSLEVINAALQYGLRGTDVILPWGLPHNSDTIYLDEEDGGVGSRYREISVDPPGDSTLVVNRDITYLDEVGEGEEGSGNVRSWCDVRVWLGKNEDGNPIWIYGEPCRKQKLKTRGGWRRHVYTSHLGQRYPTCPQCTTRNSCTHWWAVLPPDIGHKRLKLHCVNTMPDGQPFGVFGVWIQESGMGTNNNLVHGD